MGRAGRQECLRYYFTQAWSQACRSGQSEQDLMRRCVSPSACMATAWRLSNWMVANWLSLGQVISFGVRERR